MASKAQLHNQPTVNTPVFCDMDRKSGFVVDMLDRHNQLILAVVENP
jgi:hypothetical protein